MEQGRVLRDLRPRSLTSGFYALVRAIPPVSRSVPSARRWSPELRRLTHGVGFFQAPILLVGRSRILVASD